MRYFLGIILLMNSAIYGQQHLSPNLITFPVSPEAARMVTYGNTPVNLYYGQLDKTIELFNGKVGDYALPVNLNYSYAGFRVEETPSIIGLGWQLSAGGVVTREVRGYPDEGPKGYYAGGQSGPNFNIGTMTYNYALSLLNGERDGEADVYTVSVNGINFSFKIGTDGNPAFLSKHDYKISFVRNPSNVNDILSFTLTDTQGIKYLFSAREYTQRVEGQDAVFQDNFMRYGTSWQLTSIQLYGRRQITFNYDDDDFYSYSYYASGDNGILTSQIYGGTPVAKYSEGSAKDLIQRKILTGITSDNFEVSFTRSIKQNQDVYSKILIKDKQGKTVTMYDFTYQNVRNNLTKITRNTKLFYEFSYYGGANLPFMNATNVMPWKQDFWGFYNGKNNTYAFTRPASSTGPPLDSDRNPSFTHTLEGALSIIKYETGGNTTVEYEQNMIATSFQSTATQPNYRMEMHFKSDNGRGQNNPPTKEMSFTKTFNNPTVARLSHYYDVSTHGHLEMDIIKSDGDCQTQYTATVTTHNPNTGEDVITYQTIAGNYNTILPRLRTLNVPLPIICPTLRQTVSGDGCNVPGCSINENSSGTFMITPGTYKFTIRTDLNWYDHSNGGIVLDYYRPELSENQTMVNTAIGGIRIKSITDNPITGPSMTTYYDYNNDTGISTAQLYSNLVSEYKYGIGYMNPSNTGINRTSLTHVTEYSASPYNLLLKRGIPVYYKSVKKYTSKDKLFVREKVFCDDCGGLYKASYLGNDGVYGTTFTRYPRGYTEEIFESSTENTNVYPFVPKGTDYRGGRISNSTIFGPPDSEDNHKVLLSEKTRYLNYTGTNNTLVENNSNYPRSLKVGYKYRLTTEAQNITTTIPLTDLLHIITYKEADKESVLWDKTTKEHFGDSYTEKLESNEYDDHRKLKKVTVINNLNDVRSNYERLTTEVYYPYDFTDAVSQSMVTKNVIDLPVKVVSKRNDEIVETTQFNYIDLVGTPTAGLFKPKSFLKSKGDNIPDERMNYGYDSQGNVNLIYKEKIRPNLAENLKNGRTLIVWGYNKSLPIAKIENIDLSTVSQIADLEAKSNADNDNISTCPAPSCKEQQLRQALDNLRVTYPEALITTYTYDPLVGITSMTNPRGRMTTYEYDDTGRLLVVRDHEGNIISENKYRLTTQN